MTENYDWQTEGYGAEAFAAFPPNMQSESEALGFFGRLALIGAAVGILAGLSAFQISWWLSLAILIMWAIGTVAAGCFASFASKKHRAGIGYPADGEAWVRTFSLFFTIGTAFVGTTTVAISTIVTQFFAKVPAGALASNAARPVANYTPVILLAIVTVLAALGLRWLSTSRTTWLVYGAR